MTLYYKTRQILLQNATVYYKMRSLLQIATVHSTLIKISERLFLYMGNHRKKERNILGTKDKYCLGSCCLDVCIYSCSERRVVVEKPNHDLKTLMLCMHASLFSINKKLTSKIL